MAWVVAMLRCTYQNPPSSKHLDSPCLRTGSGGVIRYVYSIDYVTCSIYVCICAAAILAILVLSATFELTEWKGADQCSGVFIRFKSPNSLFILSLLGGSYTDHVTYSLTNLVHHAASWVIPYSWSITIGYSPTYQPVTNLQEYLLYVVNPALRSSHPQHWVPNT